MQSLEFAVLGHPIGHTMSPFIHQSLLQAAGIPGTYRAIDLPPEALPKAKAQLLQLSGFNVTVPYKTAILPLLDAVEGDAEAFQSVNTVKVENGRLIGYTTDGIGFRKALSAAGIQLQGNVLLLGSGGVARVFANEVLRSPDVASLTVFMRVHEGESPAAYRKRTDAFLKSLQNPNRARLEAVNAVVLSAASGHYTLLINATSAGMYPDLAGCPVEPGVIARCDAVFDAVYNPGLTMLLKQARRRRIHAIGGMDMLVWQAAASEEIWLSSAVPQTAVRHTIQTAAAQMQRQFGNIILCGFMGCGKSTTGRLLAEALGREFVDLDRYIEAQQGCSVKELFAQKGEAYFRRLERRACRVLSRKPNLVLAAGGGTLLDRVNADLLHETGTVVLLDTPYEVLARRLQNDHARPLLDRPDRDAAMLELYNARMPIYKKHADFAVPAPDSRTAAETLRAYFA